MYVPLKLLMKRPIASNSAGTKQATAYLAQLEEYDPEVYKAVKAEIEAATANAGMIMFLMFSMAGVPPFVGFFAKLNVISAVIDSGYTALAVLMVLASVVGAYYYLRVIWYMYFEEAEDKAVIQAGTDTRLVLSLNSVAVLVLGIVPGWLLALCIQILG